MFKSINDLYKHQKIKLDKYDQALNRKPIKINGFYYTNDRCYIAYYLTPNNISYRNL